MVKTRRNDYKPVEKDEVQSQVQELEDTFHILNDGGGGDVTSAWQNSIQTSLMRVVAYVDKYERRMEKVEGDIRELQDEIERTASTRPKSAPSTCTPAKGSRTWSDGRSWASSIKNSIRGFKKSKRAYSSYRSMYSWGSWRTVGRRALERRDWSRKTIKQRQTGCGYAYGLLWHS